MVVMTISRSLDLTISMMFLSGMVAAGRVSVGYIYGSEFFSEKWRIIYGTMYMLMDGMTVIFSALYFGWISKTSWPFESIGTVSGIISMIMVFFIVPESPLWQLKKGYFD